MSEDPEAKKLLAMMEKDEKLIAEETSKLVAMARRPIKVRVVCGDQETVVLGRKLRVAEVLAYYDEQNKISPTLNTDPYNTVLSTEESRQLFDLTDHYIELATGIKAETLREQIDDARIRKAIMEGILKASGFDQKELEDVRKFRPAT